MADLVSPAAISIAADSSKMNRAATPKIIDAINHFLASGDFAVGSMPEKLSEQNATPKNERTPNPHRTRPDERAPKKNAKPIRATMIRRTLEVGLMMANV